MEETCFTHTHVVFPITYCRGGGEPPKKTGETSGFRGKATKTLLEEAMIIQHGWRISGRKENIELKACVDFETWEGIIEELRNQSELEERYLAEEWKKEELMREMLYKQRAEKENGSGSERERAVEKEERAR